MPLSSLRGTLYTRASEAFGESSTSLDIDGLSDIGEALADADLFIIDNGGGGTNAKTAITRIPTYVFSGISGQIAISSSGVASFATNAEATNLTLSGNLTVNGDTVSVNTTTVTVDDPMFALADNNSADTVDIGWYGKYVDSGTKYSGLFRDASDTDMWKLFSATGNSHEAPSTTVNTTSGFTLANLSVNELTGTLATATQANITGLGTITSGTWQGTTVAVNQGGTGATSLTNLITLASHTTGDYVQNITGGTGLTSTGATSGENIAHTLSVDASQTQITAVGTIATGVWEGTDVGVSHGGTGASTATAGFDALSPMTAEGDILYGGSSGTVTKLAKGSDGEFLKLASGVPSWASVASAAVTALNSPTENELVTVGSTTTELDAESALTFSGNKLIPTATAHGAVGTALTMSSGATTAGTTNNIAGGALTLQGGQGKGSGAGGDIIFQTANAGGSGSSLNALATALTLSDDLSATFGGNVVVPTGATVGPVGDTDLVTLTASGSIVTVAGELSATTLDIGGTDIAATAAEINLLDGSAKSTASITIADSDAFIVIDGTTTKQIPASDIATYASGSSATKGFAIAMAVAL